jgi:tRNA pseudouridine55 synthase
MMGVFLVDKPAGPTSFDVLRQLRPALGRKLGHAGTLDPFATGLLLVLAGGATRLAAHLSGLDKSYRAVIQLGATSSTLDGEGELTPTGASTDGPALREAAASLTGVIEQRVPLASAVRVGGERSYTRMRRGETAPPPPRTVRIDRLDVLGFDDALQQATVEVACSKGTYVRQIAEDLGDATGAGGYCLELRRLTIGGFSVEHAGTPDQIAGDPDGRWHLSARDALAHMPERALDDAEMEHIRHGRAVPARDERGPVRLVHGGDLVAIAAPGEGGLQPTTVLRP